MQLKLKNFRCHENEVFEFYEGIMLVKGASGSGKSSIFEAINFCLYGEGKKVIKYGSKTCEVEMTWKNYVINRGKNPNKFNVYDVEDKKKYEDACAQEIVFSIFGKYFTMGGYLSQMNTNSFINLNSVEKLKFLEKIAFGENNNIDELKDKRKKVLKKLETNLVEVRSKIEFVEKINEKDPIDESIKEYNFPVRCKITDRTLAEKNTDTIIKNETSRIHKNKENLVLKKKEYDDVINLENRIFDIEKDIIENNTRIEEINYIIGDDKYDESEYADRKNEFINIKKEIASKNEIIRENEDNNIKIYKSKKALKIYKSKLKDLEEIEHNNNLETLSKDLVDVKNTIARKETEIKINKIQEEIDKSKEKFEIIQEKENENNINILKLNELYTNDELNSNISFYKKYTKNIIEYNKLKLLYEKDINCNEEYSKICKKIEKREKDNCVISMCPSCGENLKIDSGGKLYIYCKEEVNEEKVNEEEDLENMKTEVCKKIIENDMIKKRMSEFEEMYEELDTREKSIENYNYYVELKKERNELENTINEFNKFKQVLLDLGKKIKEKENEIAMCESQIEKIKCSSEYYKCDINDLKDMLDKKKENIYKVNLCLEEKKKLDEKINEMVTIISKIERKSISDEEVRNIKICIEDMTREEKRINDGIMEMEIKRNKIVGLNNEKKRLEDQTIDKKRQCYKIKNDHMSAYNYKDEYIKKESIYTEIKNIEDVITEKNEIKIKNEKIKDEIIKWKNNMIIVKKNKERKKEFDGLKEEENVCIQYCTAIDIFKRKIIETESMLLGQLIGTINAYANIYIDGFFQDQIITVELSPYKKLKKSSKNQINLILTYKGEECDFNNLSGGEQTRIILAYTMAFSEILYSPVVMLDEAMASLDQDTTDIVSKTIKYNCKNKIVILIAHQVVQGNFDRIISLD